MIAIVMPFQSAIVRRQSAVAGKRRFRITPKASTDQRLLKVIP